MTFKGRLLLAYSLLWVLALVAILALAHISVGAGLLKHTKDSLLEDLKQVGQFYDSDIAGSAPMQTGGTRIEFFDQTTGLVLDTTAEQIIPPEYIRQASKQATVMDLAAGNAVVLPMQADAPATTTAAKAKVATNKNTISTGEPLGAPPVPVKKPRYVVAFKTLESLGAVLAVLQPVDFIEDVRSSLLRTLLQAFALVLVVGLVIIYFAAGLAVRPLEVAARQIAKRGPNKLELLDYKGPNDQLGQIVTSVNVLLAALQEASEREKAFLAEVSHELRTPITSLNGYLDRIQRNPHDASNVEGAVRTLAHVTRMVGDLLALAKGEAQRHINAHVVHLPDILNQVVAEYPGVSLKHWQHPDVLGDPDRLQQLIRNLVSNAVRAAGSAQRVQVQCWTNQTLDHILQPPQNTNLLEQVIYSTPYTPQGPQAVVLVADQGAGIDAEVLPKLFSRFARGPQGGTGLGLAVVKQIAEAHGGAVAVRSTLEGTWFWVLLPLLEEEPED